MSNEFISYYQALELKELGFDKPCLAFYSLNKELHPVMQEPAKGPYFNNGNFVETLRAPLYQQTFRWFREEHRLSSWIYNSDTTKYFYTILQNGRIVKATGSLITYEEAELACLKKLIEIVKEKTTNKKQVL